MPNFDHRYGRIFIESVSTNIEFVIRTKDAHKLYTQTWLVAYEQWNKTSKTGPYKTYTNEKYHL